MQNNSINRGKVLALDYGSKRIGIASGDFENRISFPRGMIENKNFDYVFAKIADFCKQWAVKMIVIGLPLNMKEEHIVNPIMVAAKSFHKKLEKKFEKDPELKNIVIDFFDERLSSFEADKLMKEAVGIVKIEKGDRDSFSAQIILQRFFDSL